MTEQLKALRGCDDPTIRRGAELMCAALGGMSLLQSSDGHDEVLEQKVRGLWLEGQRQLAAAAASTLADTPTPRATIPHLGAAKSERDLPQRLAQELSSFAAQLQDVLPPGLDPK